MGRFFRGSIIFLPLLLVFFSAVASPASAEQPKTDLNADTYSRMLTGYTTDKELESLTNDPEPIPPTIAILDKSGLPGECTVGDKGSCKGPVVIQDKMRNGSPGVTRTVDITGKCEPYKSETTNGESTKGAAGKCVYQKRPLMDIRYIGADTSAVDNLAIPDYQSYNNFYDVPHCGSSTSNVLEFGTHNLILPDIYQAKLRLGMLLRAEATYSTYWNQYNVHKELPIGGVNWKEKVNIDGVNYDLLGLAGKVGGMLAPSWQAIWETQATPSADTDFTDPNADPNLASNPKRTWFSQWYDKYQADRLAGADWIRYFECVPLYPHDTNEPTLMMNHMVIGNVFESIFDPSKSYYNTALERGDLSSDFSSRTAFEGAYTQAQITLDSESAKALRKSLAKAQPLVGGYYNNPKTAFIYTPSAMVYGKQNVGTNEDEAHIKTPQLALDINTFGLILDYPNTVYNRENPPPRKPEVSNGFNTQEAKAVHPESGVVEIILHALAPIFQLINVSTYTTATCGPYCQGNRYLESAIYPTYANAAELASANLLDEKPVNSQMGSTGNAYPTSERASHDIKNAFSRYMACYSPDRFYYTSQPKDVANGTAENTCGQSGANTPTSGICAIAAKYNVDCCLLAAIWTIETDQSKLIPTGSAGGYKCCNSIGACGATQIMQGLVPPLSNGENLNPCKEEDSFTLTSRLLNVKKCQLAGGCQDNKWTREVSKKYPIKATDLVVAGTYYGVNNCAPDSVTQARWGNGVSYCDAVKSYQKACTVTNPTGGHLPPDVNQ